MDSEIVRNDETEAPRYGRVGRARLRSVPTAARPWSHQHRTNVSFKRHLEQRGNVHLQFDCIYAPERVCGMRFIVVFFC